MDSIDPPDYSVYIYGGALVVIALAVLAYTGVLSRIRAYFQPALPILPLEPPTYKPDTYTEPPGKTRLPFDNTRNQTWCFIGEDNTGRYCVKVPRADLCDPVRTFGQRESCELVEGSQMPLAIVTKSGHSVTPISKTTIVNSAKIVSKNDSEAPFFGPEPNPNPTNSATLTPISPLYPFSSQTRTSVD